MIEEVRYQVQIYGKEKAMRVSKEVRESLKGVVSGRMMARMRREAVDCPVLQKEVPFLECFNCNNFIRRFKGMVDCAGLPLEGS